MHRQKTIVLEKITIFQLDMKINELILDGARVDMVIPNKGMKDGWIIIYTPNH